MANKARSAHPARRGSACRVPSAQLATTNLVSNKGEWNNNYSIKF